MSESLALRPEANAFARFVSWWLEGLSAASDLRPRSRQPWTRLLVRTASGVSLHVRRRGKIRLTHDIPRAALDDPEKSRRLPSRARGRRGDVSVLRLGTDQILRHDMRIPKAARDVVDPVVRNQLERLVPWPAEDLVYGYEIDDETSDSDHVRVTCVATSAARVAAALADARAVGFEPDSLDVAEEATEPLGIQLRGLALGRDGMSPRRIAHALGLVTLITTLIAGAGLWRMVGLDSDLSALSASIAEIRTRVAESHRLEEENVALVAERARLVALRAGEPAMVTTLDALSKSLPDHAYLERLEIREREAELRGLARDAASLMAGLEKSPAFADARFSAPTTRESGGERFAITLQLERPTAKGVGQ